MRSAHRSTVIVLAGLARVLWCSLAQAASHIDLCDRPQFVTPTIAKLKELLRQYLTAEGGRA